MKNSVKTALAAFAILAGVLLLSISSTEAAPAAPPATMATVMSPDGSRTLTVTVENPMLVTSPAQPMAAPMAVAPATMASPAVIAKEASPASAKKKMSSGEIADLIFKILGGLASLIFTVLGGLGYMKWAKSERFKQIQKYVDMAFPAVEALVSKTHTKVDDKLVAFLKMVNESLRKAGASELTDAETAAAKDVAAKKALAAKLKG